MCFRHHTAVNHADHRLLEDDQGDRNSISHGKVRGGCWEMNLLLIESHFLLPRGGHCSLVEGALILCYIDSRRDCGKGLCYEASVREKLHWHLQKSDTEKKHEEWRSYCTNMTWIFPGTAFITWISVRSGQPINFVKWNWKGLYFSVECQLKKWNQSNFSSTCYLSSVNYHYYFVMHFLFILTEWTKNIQKINFYFIVPHVIVSLWFYFISD